MATGEPCPCPPHTFTASHPTQTLRRAHAPCPPQHAHTPPRGAQPEGHTDTRRPRTLGRTAADTLRLAGSLAPRPPACTPARCPPPSRGRARARAPVTPAGGDRPAVGPPPLPRSDPAGPRSQATHRSAGGSAAGGRSGARPGGRPAGAEGPTRVGGASAARPSAGFRRRLRGPARVPAPPHRGAAPPPALVRAAATLARGAPRGYRTAPGPFRAPEPLRPRVI